MSIANIVLLAGMSCLSFTSARTLSRIEDQAFMIAGSRTSENMVLERSARSVETSITRMHITSVIVSRFARVTVVSDMQNELDEAKEVTFSMRLPEAAFITEFTMNVDGVIFVGKVKEKELAEKEYQNAITSGNSAGLVTANVRETQTFNVAANVPAHSTVTFNLVYQQLLKRKLGKYNHEILVNPKQVIDDLVVDVYITEKTGITSLQAKSPQDRKISRAKALSESEDGSVLVDTEIRRSKHQAKVSFKPTPTQQRRLLMLDEDDRKFTVNYDVTREVLGGEIQTRNGYFVHFFAPEGLPIIPKQIVFVIDRSGSMSGRKMDQTKTAFETVLKELRTIDKFNIVTFSSDVTVWKKESLVEASVANILEAVKYVKKIAAVGGTNLNEAVLRGSKLLDGVKLDDEASSAIVVLTDGLPTTGVTKEEAIRVNIKKSVEDRFSVFCLGFGKDLNHDFMKRIAHENSGIARRIYEDADADLQLEGFFQEIATPLLLNVKMTYSGSNITDLSDVHCDKYFDGSEVIVVGAFKDSAAGSSVKGHIEGTSGKGDVTYNVTSSEVDENFRHWYDDTGDFDDFIERIWAYFTIRELIEKKVVAETKAEIKEIIDRVVKLALKYSFVTHYTSMVVTLPEDEITTPPPTPTTYPTLPPCYWRGSPAADYLTHRPWPPIWCPYVFEAENTPTSPRIPYLPSYGAYGVPRSLQGQAAQSGRSAAPAYGTYSRIIGGAAAAPPQYYNSYVSDFFESPYYYIPRGPKLLASCSGKLTSSKGSVKSPQPPPAEAAYCEWTISLKTGSWIDLYYSINTTQNKVTISDDKETLLDLSGAVPFTYIPITTNKITIRMTVYPDDKSDPGIVISYKKFMPRSSRYKLGEKPPAEVAVTPYNSNCGYNVNIEDGNPGSISSPNYPEVYPSNARCMWRITNEDTSDLELHLRVDDLDIEMSEESECIHDKLVISDGDDVNTLCGFESGMKFVTDAKTTEIVFISDGKFEATGFKILYEFVRKSTEPSTYA